jgi:hypothetical protein
MGRNGLLQDTTAASVGRHPGVVQVTFRAPVQRLDACGLLGCATEQYGGLETL